MKKSRFETAVEHHQAGRFADAEMFYRRVLALEPNHADALHLLGVLAAQIGRFDDAVQLISRACALSPNVADYRSHLGNALGEKKQFPAAMDAYRQALRLNPKCFISHDGLGAALRETGHLDEAVASHRRSIAINPKNPHAHYNLGMTLATMGLLDEAIASYQAAIAISPNYPEAHWNMALILLMQGDLERGWREYEWRWSRNDFPTLWPSFRQPRWDGGDPAGMTLLVHSEQGYGDAVQFVRYAPLLKARGAKVILLCQAPLARLMNSAGGVDRVISAITSPAELPPFDAHCPMMSLPFHFGTRLDSIPADAPYLSAEPSLRSQWAAKMGVATAPLKVGLAWSGSPTNKNDRHRSIALEKLAPLSGADATFYSLQKGPAAAQAAHPPAGMHLIDLTADLKDFADTAALISNLDLVITVDTAVAHLAGAMDIPAWVLLASEQDWRWLLKREDSPWYPALRLFRQSTPGDWPPVIERVATALAEYGPRARLAA
jgi:tetratricopeptide (TPR) repeat protein